MNLARRCAEIIFGLVLFVSTAFSQQNVGAAGIIEEAGGEASNPETYPASFWAAGIKPDFKTGEIVLSPAGEEWPDPPIVSRIKFTGATIDERGTIRAYARNAVLTIRATSETHLVVELSPVNGKFDFPALKFGVDSIGGANASLATLEASCAYPCRCDGGAVKGCTQDDCSTIKRCPRGENGESCGYGRAIAPLRGTKCGYGS